MSEYKAEVKCAASPERSKMRGSVQFGLLCFSMLISSLHGENIDMQSKEIPPYFEFEQEDLHQFEVPENEQEWNLDSDIIPVLSRVRRQSEPTVKKTNNTNVNKPKRPRLRTQPGSLSVLREQAPRSKRQSNNNGKRKKPKYNPGRGSMLAHPPPQIPKLTEVKIA